MALSVALKYSNSTAQQYGLPGHCLIVIIGLGCGAGRHHQWRQSGATTLQVSNAEEEKSGGPQQFHEDKKKAAPNKANWQIQVILQVWTQTWTMYFYYNVCQGLNKTVMERYLHLMDVWLSLRRILDVLVQPTIPDAQDPDSTLTKENLPIYNPRSAKEFSHFNLHSDYFTGLSTLSQRKEIINLIKEHVANSSSKSQQAPPTAITSTNITTAGAVAVAVAAAVAVASHDFEELFFPANSSKKSGEISQLIHLTGRDNICKLKSKGDVGNLIVDLRISRFLEARAKPENDRWRCVFKKGVVITKGPNDALEQQVDQLFAEMVQRVKNSPDLEHTVVKKKFWRL